MVVFWSQLQMRAPLLVVADVVQLRKAAHHRRPAAQHRRRRWRVRRPLLVVGVRCVAAAAAADDRFAEPMSLVLVVLLVHGLCGLVLTLMRLLVAGVAWLIWLLLLLVIRMMLFLLLLQRRGCDQTVSRAAALVPKRAGTAQNLRRRPAVDAGVVDGESTATAAAAAETCRSLQITGTRLLLMVMLKVCRQLGRRRWQISTNAGVGAWNNLQTFSMLGEHHVT